ncbi:MAG: hypothetical protein AAF556_01695 [Pseudomonadota bacterium]
MTNLPRLKPDPLPPIHPLPERLAAGARLDFYRETKRALKVPWMGVVTMAFAHYPNFYSTLWTAAKPVVRSAEFIAACHELRRFTEARIPPQTDLTQRLVEMGYDAVELMQIRDLIEVFSHGNMPYILIASTARLLLEGHPIATETTLTPSTERHGLNPSIPPNPPIPHVTPLVLIEEHHADSGLAATYDALRNTLGLPFVNTDYRALARWPSYFTTAWSGLHAAITEPGYEAHLTAIHDRVVTLASALPNPTGITPDALQAAAAKDGNPTLILDTVRLFQWLLPGLLFNVAVLRAQLPED